jgi:hypothetical protein
MPKNSPIIQEDVAGDMPQHMPSTHPDTLGHDPVRIDLEALEHEIEANASDQRVEWMNKIVAEKLAPTQVSTTERVLGRLGIRDDIMTKKEAGLVTSTALQDVGNSERLQPMIEKKRKDVDDALEEVRINLLSLDDQDDPKRAESLVALHESLSPHQKTLFKREFEEDPSLSLFKWLAEKKADNMPDGTEEERQAKELQEAEDRHRLLNFLQSHNSYLADRQQKPDFIRGVETQKRLFSKGVKQALKEGRLHESAASALDQVKHTRVYLGDFFSTNFLHRGGYYRIGDKNQVSVASGAEEYATVHELNHALLETFPDQANHTKAFAQEWLVEAVTEELAQTFKGAKFGDFNTSRGAYPEYRDLLQTVLDVADQLKTGIDFSDFTRAYSAPEQEQDQIIRQIAQTFFDKGYPNLNIFADVKDMINARLDEIVANPDHQQLNKRKQRALAAKQAAGNLRNVARSLADKKVSAGATS